MNDKHNKLDSNKNVDPAHPPTKNDDDEKKKKNKTKKEKGDQVIVPMFDDPILANLAELRSRLWANEMTMMLKISHLECRIKMIEDYATKRGWNIKGLPPT